MSLFDYSDFCSTVAVLNINFLSYNIAKSRFDYCLFANNYLYWLSVRELS